MADMTCLFCSIVAGDASAVVVLDEPDVLAFLDIHPVFKGHVLVVPKHHVVTLPELPVAQLAPLFGVVQRVGDALQRGLGADGHWVAINNVVSQAVPHLHVHVVPRRRKDGLRGFFWPRERYVDDAEMAAYATAISDVLSD
jgi:histidine triad (HIT) family protein